MTRTVSAIFAQYLSMFFFILASLLFLALPRDPLQETLYQRIDIWIAPLHKICLSAAPLSLFKNQYQALVCGAPLTTGAFQTQLRNLGLIHIMVVSGAHFVFLIQIFNFVTRRFPQLKMIRYPILFFYACVTLLQPPVVRSLLQILLHDVSRFFKFSWSQTQIILLSGLFTWVLFPHWILSLSFLLSSLVAFSMSAPLPGTQNAKSFKSIWIRQIWIYFFMFPALLLINFPHPISIVTNVLVAPLLGNILFPLSIVCFFFQRASFLVDLLWQLFDFVLSAFASMAAPIPISIQVPILSLWGYAWSLQTLALPLETLRRRMKI